MLCRGETIGRWGEWRLVTRTRCLGTVDKMRRVGGGLKRGDEDASFLLFVIIPSRTLILS